MTKLYCPKGHASLYEDHPHYDRLGASHEMFICNHLDCYRSYFEMDCLTQAQINSNSPEFKGNKKEDVNDIDVVESKVIPSEMQRKYCIHVWNYLGIASNSKGICTKCGATTDEITALPLDQVMQWVNPKRESQVAIDRVVKALKKIFLSLLDQQSKGNKKCNQELTFVDLKIALHEAIKELKK